MDRIAYGGIFRLAVPLVGWWLVAAGWQVSATAVCTPHIAVSRDDDLTFALLGGAVVAAIAGAVLNIAPVMRRQDWVVFGVLGAGTVVAILARGVGGALAALAVVALVAVARHRNDVPRAKLHVASTVASVLIVPAALLAASFAALRCESMF